MRSLLAVGVVIALVPILSRSALGQDVADTAVHAFEIQAPNLVLSGVPFRVEVRALDGEGQVLTTYRGTPELTGAEAPSPSFQEGTWVTGDARVTATGRQSLEIRDGTVSGSTAIRVMPGILSILPPIFAIVLALVFRQVIISLFAGIWLGAFFLYDYNPVSGFYGVLDHFLIEALVDRSHTQIVVFSMLFGGMVGVITRNGGARGIAGMITRYARTARGGQLAAWGTALVLFFDDYANALVRGNLMRPITDRLRISREKLSYIVDAGAASVPSVFLISTWIGYEVGLIDDGLRLIQSDQNAYSVFVATIPYRFYPILVMGLTFIIGFSGRDFGPMLTAERRAYSSGKVLRDGAQPATEVLEEDEGVPARWYNGLLPIATVLAVAFFGIFWTGSQALRSSGVEQYGFAEILSSSDSYVALLWASLSGCVVAMALAVVQRIMNVTQSIDAWFQGLKAMLMAVVILLLAWSIGAVTVELHTADYVVQALRDVLSPHWLPVLTFVVAASIAFATGTSWATMAIIMPLVIPLGHTLSLDSDMNAADANVILVGVISSVLAGAVFGDHCSPISDTTILSSMSSACDHIDHVRTQLPYALLAAFVGMLVGDIPTAFGLSPAISLVLGFGVLAAIMYLFGKRVDQGDTSSVR